MCLSVRYLPIVLDGQEILCPLYEVTHATDEYAYILNYPCIGCEFGGNAVITRDQGRRFYRNPWGEIREHAHPVWPLWESRDLILGLHKVATSHILVGCESRGVQRVSDERCMGVDVLGVSPARWYHYENWLEIFGDQYPDHILG